MKQKKFNQILKNLGDKGYNENLKIIINIKGSNPAFKMDDIELENYEACCQRFLNNLLTKTIHAQINYFNNKKQ